MSKNGKSFYDDLGKNDQRAVKKILSIKMKNNDFSLLTGKDALDQQAIEYFAQKQAFQDVLVNKSFQLVDSVSVDYSGKISFLTFHGTFAILGKVNGIYRSVYSKRIHSPELDYNGQYCRLLEGLKIDKMPQIRLEKGNTMTHSELVGLAVTDEDGGDEKSSFSQISKTVTQTSIKLCCNPDEIRINKRFNPDDYIIDQ